MICNYGPASQVAQDEIWFKLDEAEKDIDSLNLRVNEFSATVDGFNATISDVTQRTEATEIKMLEIEGSIDGLSVTVSGITEDGGLIDSKVQQEADSLKLKFTEKTEFEERCSSIEATIDGIQMGEGTSVTWATLDQTIKDQIVAAQNTAASAQEQAGTAHSLAQTAQNTAEGADEVADDSWSQIRAWVNGTGTTYINGKMITAGTVIAKSLQGSEVGIYNSSGKIVAYMMPETTTSSGLTIDSNYSIRLLADNNIYLYSGANGNSIQFYDANQTDSIIIAAPSVIGKGTGSDLGKSNRKWSNIYANNGTIQTSDANQKNSIEELPDKYIELFDELAPRRYKLNNGTSGRYHVGFVAQEVEKAMIASDIDSKEFGGFIKDKDEDGNDSYMLRYDEFIGILTAKIKQLETRIEQLEGK